MWGLPLVVVGAVPREGVILVMLAVVGVGNAMVDVGIFTLPPRLVPDAVLARLFGALESLGALVVAGACLLTPVLLDLVGMRWALVVVGALGPVYVAVAWTRLRAIDRTVTRRDLEIGLLDELPMFRPLAMPAIEQLADRLEVQTFEAGDTWSTQGDDGDRFYVIEHGTARVVRDGAVRPRSGRRRLLRGDRAAARCPPHRLGHRDDAAAVALARPRRLPRRRRRPTASRAAAERSSPTGSTPTRRRCIDFARLACVGVGSLDTEVELAAVRRSSPRRRHRARRARAARHHVRQPRPRPPRSR